MAGFEVIAEALSPCASQAVFDAWRKLRHPRTAAQLITRMSVVRVRISRSSYNDAGLPQVFDRLPRHFDGHVARPQRDQIRHRSRELGYQTQNVCSADVRRGPLEAGMMERWPCANALLFKHGC